MLSSGYTKAPAMVSTAGAEAEGIKRSYCKSGVTPWKKSNTSRFFSQDVLTQGRPAGMVCSELQNSSEKASRSLDTGIFYCVHAQKKHGVFTAIHGREWANTIPARGICPAFSDAFELPAFFALFETVTTCRTSKIQRG